VPRVLTWSDGDGGWPWAAALLGRAAAHRANAPAYQFAGPLHQRRNGSGPSETRGFRQAGKRFVAEAHP